MDTKRLKEVLNEVQSHAWTMGHGTYDMSNDTTIAEAVEAIEALSDHAVAESIRAISYHFAIPTEDLLKAVKDGIPEEK